LYVERRGGAVNLRQRVRVRTNVEKPVNKEQKNKRLKAFIGSGIALLATTYFGQDLDPAIIEKISETIITLYIAYAGGQTASDMVKYYKGR
jgi:hypothetical protein